MKKDNKDKFKKLETDLKILAESHRLAILHLLKTKGSVSVGQIADSLEISFKATSKHLLFLTKKGILKRHHDGPFVLYCLSNDLPKSIHSSVLKLL